MRTMYLATVASEMSMPTLRSSPWILGAPPQRVGFGHPADEVSDFACHRGTSGFPAALPSPVELEFLTMPPNDGRWLHDNQRRAPATPEPGHQGPEHAITRLHPRPLDGAAQDGKLLTQREILSDQDSSALDEDSKQVRKGLQHYFRSFSGGT